MNKEVRIFTGSYNKCKNGNLISISGDKGKSVGFNGNSYIKLAPKRDFWNIWHANIGKISDDENNRYYMQEYYNQVLSKLDDRKVLEELATFGDNIVLLCFEKEYEFCHRHLVAIWLEKNLQIKVPEVSIDETGKFHLLERNKKYVEEFRKILEAYEVK